MNCDQIQEHLSQYLDHPLDHEKRREIEDHLASCPHCLPEAKLLSDGIKGVAALPEIEPPAGFSRRVMARIRAESEGPTFGARLFQPLRIKIPLYATALLGVVGLAVYLYRANALSQRETVVSSAPSESASAPKPPVIPPAEETPPIGFQRKEDAPVTADPLSPDVALTLRPHDAAGKTAALTSRMKQAAERSGGKVFALITDPTEGNLKSNYWLNLPKTEFGRFKTELSKIGQILSESQPASSGPRSDLKPSSPMQVMVTVILENSKGSEPAAPPSPN